MTNIFFNTDLTLAILSILLAWMVIHQSQAPALVSSSCVTLIRIDARLREIFQNNFIDEPFLTPPGFDPAPRHRFTALITGKRLRIWTYPEERKGKRRSPV